MIEPAVPASEVICSVCGRPMILLHTIRRAFAEALYVWQCKPCGFSMTEPASWTTRPQNVALGTEEPPHVPTYSPETGEPYGAVAQGIRDAGSKPQSASSESGKAAAVDGWLDRALHRWFGVRGR
jgi:hypothetical protein